MPCIPYTLFIHHFIWTYHTINYISSILLPLTLSPHSTSNMTCLHDDVFIICYQGYISISFLPGFMFDVITTKQIAKNKENGFWRLVQNNYQPEENKERSVKASEGSSLTYLIGYLLLILIVLLLYLS